MQARCLSCTAVYVFRFAGPCAFFGSARCACVRRTFAGMLETAPLLRMKAGNTKPVPAYA